MLLTACSQQVVAAAVVLNDEGKKMQGIGAPLARAFLWLQRVPLPVQPAPRTLHGEGKQTKVHSFLCHVCIP